MLKTFGELITYLMGDLLEGRYERLTTEFYKDALAFKLFGLNSITITYYPTIASKDKCVIIECPNLICENLKDMRMICDMAETIADERQVIDNEFFKEVEVYEDND